MEGGIKVAPLPLHVLVGLHFHLTLAPFDAIFVVPGYEVVEHQGIDALAAVFGQHANHHQVDGIGLMELQCTKDMPPSERQETTATAFLERTGDRRNGND